MTKKRPNKKFRKIILGIETSCDDTGIGLVTTDGELIGDLKFSSAQIQAQYGGVVPEVAARFHADQILPLTEKLLKQYDVSIAEIVAITYTEQPGLIGCLLVGQAFAKTLSWLWNIPILAINHIAAHIFSIGLTEPIVFPFLALVASGKTTSLFHVKSFSDFELLNATIDDAIGEAYDKVGRIMNLAYPAGPKIDQLYNDHLIVPNLAQQPPANKPFSYSGIKTAAINYWKTLDHDNLVHSQQLLATAFQKWVIKSLMRKIDYYQKKLNLTNVAIVGGVAANQLLRSEISKTNLKVALVDHQYATDNGAMVAYYGAMLYNQDK